MMHEREKSDPAVVAVKPTNKAERSAAEPVEPRAGAKGNAEQHSTCRAQYRVSVSQALERIRQVRRHSPEVGAVCGKAARTDLCGGRSEMSVPTAIAPLAMTAPLFAMTAKLLRRGADGRTAGRPVQECDRCKRAKPRTDRREGDIDPVFGVADHGVRREQIPYAAPRCRRHTPARHHGGGEHHIDRIGCGSRK